MLLNTDKKKIIALFSSFLFAGILSYLFVDVKLAIFIQKHFSPSWLEFFQDITFPIEPLLVPLYLLALLKIFENSTKMIRLLIDFGAATLTNIALIPLLKFILARPRPQFFLTHGVSHIMPFQITKNLVSMPSGHASGAGLILAMMYILLKGKMRLFLIIPPILALSRALSLKHFLSDVIIGFGVGYTLIFIFQTHFKGFFEKLKDAIWKTPK